MAADPSRIEFVLAADIGGTRARLALARRDGKRVSLERVEVIPVREAASLEDAVAGFLAQGPRPVRACLAWAGPIEGARARLTNGPWVADSAALAARFGLDRVTLVNDFHAAAAGVDEVGDDALHVLQPGASDPAGARLVIGAGTGLGVAYALRDVHGTRVIAGEGGHVAFAPQDDEQAALWRHLRKRMDRVTAEHVVSGPGIVNLYDFCCASSGAPPDEARLREGAAGVNRLAQAGDPHAVHALELFCAIFGAVAGDHALSCLATGGVYIAGGIAARLGERLGDGRFVAAFCAKGVHAALVARMPVWRVRDEKLGLRGAAALALAQA